MTRCAVERLRPDPAFDLETYRRISEGASSSGITIWEYSDIFEKLKNYLMCYHFHRHDLADILLVYLEAPAERLLAETWTRSPAKGFLLHTLAVSLMMAAAGELIPEIRVAGCAPLPAPDRPLRDCLNQVGLTLSDSGALNRQYAVMTFFPYRGGCAVCHLRDACPKRRRPNGRASPS